MNKYTTISHVRYMEFAWLIVSSEWVTELARHTIMDPPFNNNWSREVKDWVQVITRDLEWAA